MIEVEVPTGIASNTRRFHRSVSMRPTMGGLQYGKASLRQTLESGEVRVL